MRIRMLATRQGSPDGHQVVTYEAGRVYELAIELARPFLFEGWAESLDAPVLKAPKRTHAQQRKKEYR